VIRAVRPAQPGSPQGGAKDHHGQEEEDAGDLKPQNSADPAEGAQEARQALSDSMPGLPSDLANWSAGGAILGDGSILGGAGGGGTGRLAVGGLCGGGYALPDDAACDADSNAESAANGLRLHFDLMVTAWLLTALLGDCWLLAVALGRRKK
jgi:hypothetical protein